MTILYAGGEDEAFTLGGSAVGVTTASTFDSTYARGSLSTGTSTGTIDTPVFSSATTFWLHFDYYPNSGGSGAQIIQLYNSSGTVVFKLNVASSLVIQPQYYNGAGFTNIGTTYTATSATRVVFDLKVVCGGSGSFELYANGTLVSSGSASMTSVDNIAKVRMTSLQTNVASYFSQVICADVATVGWKLHLKPPTGNGANTAWTGAFGDVDEAVLSDADFISSAAANDIETYTGAALSLGSGTVKGVVVSARAKNDGAAPQNLQLALRRGSTNYFSGNVSGIGAGYLPFQNIWETDPSTSAVWTAANAADAATEFGVKSIT